MPDIIDEEETLATDPEVSLDMRRADALYAMASARIADDHDPDRSTVVVHADIDALEGRGGSCRIEDGAAIHAETALRLSCDSRLEIHLHNEIGDVVGVGRAQRTPTPWMERALRDRDRGCAFGGCEAKRFLHAHHIEHWSRGGRTDLDNLVLVCAFHHKLLHEYGWNVELGPSGVARWLKPGGRHYEPGRASDRRRLVA